MRQVLLVQREPQVLRVNKVFKAFKVSLVRQVLLVQRELRVNKAFKVYKAFKV